MSINRSGYQMTNNGVEIDKDSEAQLIYTFDWSQWLYQGDRLTSVEYEVSARRNDPGPVTILSEGVDPSGVQSYVELAGGQDKKSYIVTAKIVTTSGLVDRRNFRVNVVDRKA
jgi:hypothetical protein